MNTFQAIGVTKTFPGVKALDNVSFTVKSGEVLAIVGENGAGKSTLIKILSGIYQPDDGNLKINDETISFATPQSAFDAGIAVVHQELSYVPELTVAENIMMARYPRTKFGFVDWKIIYRDAKAILLRLGLDIDPSIPVKKCSTAQKQQVEIAKALYWNARLVIFDEPTAVLNDDESANLFRCIQELKQNGVAIIYISHKLGEVFQLADTISVLRDGKHIATHKAKSITQQDLITLMVGRELSDLYPKTNTLLGDVVLEAVGLSNGICQDISFSLRRGEILGVYGMMGSGHVELGQMLFGDKPATQGKLYIEGSPVRIRQPIDAIHHGISYVPSERKTEGLALIHSVEANVVSVHYEIAQKAMLDIEHDSRVTKEWIDTMRIKTPSGKTLTQSLSGGNQQKVVLAKWMLVSPRILIMVDPTRGIDVGSKAEIYQMMDHFAANGMSVIMITSEMPELIGMSDRAIVMCQGRINGNFPKESLTQEAIVYAAIGGGE